MDGSTAGNANLLIDKGSVFDLVAIFISLLGGTKEFANRICNLFMQYLDNGYTYQDIKKEILTAFYSKNKTFRWNIFHKPKRNNDNNYNLLKNGTRYYHNQLKVLNDLPQVTYDINQGTMVSRTPEYFLEPVASYTIQEFIQYFYKNVPIDLQSQPPDKMLGLAKYKVGVFGIDKILFMTDICAQYCKENNLVFNLNKIDEYSIIADEHLSMVKSNYPDNEPYYTFKERKLPFNV